MGSLQPTFSPNEPTWRGSTSSSEMNENFEQILYDLNTVFSEAANLVVELSELESEMRYECVALNQRMMAVSGLISAYEIESSGYKMFHEDFYLATNSTYPLTLPEEEKCVVDTRFGVVTLPVNNSFSKLYTTNLSTGDVVTAADLIVVVEDLNEVAKFWNSKKHKELVKNIDVNTCTKCTYAAFNEIVEQVVIEDSMCRNFP